MQLDCLELIGRSMMVIGEVERAKCCWERFLATTHPPIAEPTGRYYLGECRWHLGDPARCAAGVPPRHGSGNRFVSCPARRREGFASSRKLAGKGRSDLSRAVDAEPL